MIKRVYLEITNACNLNCPFCEYKKGSSFMSFEDVDRFTDMIAPYCSYIYLHVLGEPLMHPDFDRIMKLLEQKKFKVQLVTNGTLLDRHPDLVHYPALRKLSVSVHSVSSENIGSNYFESLKKLINNPDNKIIDLRFYNRKHLSSDVLEFYGYLEQNYAFKETNFKNCHSIANNVFVTEEEFFNWPKIADPYISDCGYCHGGSDMLAILNNGDVTLCCLDPKGHNTLGNLHQKSLRDILEGNDYLSVVESFKNKKVIKDLCQKCSYRLRFDGKRH